jgi:hypothetical protein
MRCRRRRYLDADKPLFCVYFQKTHPVSGAAAVFATYSERGHWVQDFGSEYSFLGRIFEYENQGFYEHCHTIDHFLYGNEYPI